MKKILIGLLLALLLCGCTPTTSNPEFTDPTFPTYDVDVNENQTPFG